MGGWSAGCPCVQRPDVSSDPPRARLDPAVADREHHAERIRRGIREACVSTGLKKLTWTSALLRLECSIDCVSGSVGHQPHIFRSFYHCQRFF